jgi:cytosine/adenosine deaminase-related metal-dependent hydrolase
MNGLVWLDEQGLLNDRTQVVHAVYVDEDGIRRLPRVGAAMVHCPGSNLYGGRCRAHPGDAKGRCSRRDRNKRSGEQQRP